MKGTVFIFLHFNETKMTQYHNRNTSRVDTKSNVVQY